MKTRLVNELPFHNLTTHSAPHLYIVDYKSINDGSVILHEDKPLNIKYVYLSNQNEVTVCFDGFTNNALPLSAGSQNQQCECVIFPDRCFETDWILFVETKYVNNRKAAFNEIRGYPNKMTTQIIETVQYFRNKGIIETNKKVWAIVSFPILIEEFNSTIFKGDLSETDILFKHRIVIRGTNSASIISEKRIKLNSL
ncbi:MAG: hypothetical protein A2046_11455 [Bacteroidetes bacterium GWA2_30_7]|nr:MAG: hypothetical protein A2046_11455 [Bacteroidetes bacterium GWA2_30_7]